MSYAIKIQREKQRVAHRLSQTVDMSGQVQKLQLHFPVCAMERPKIKLTAR